MTAGRKLTDVNGTIGKILISDRIRQYRHEHELTQGEFGALLRVSAQAVSKWERGESYPDITSLPLLASILSCSVSDFFA